MTRRTLSFKNLDEVLGDLENLTGKEVKTHGTWSFYQILNHLAIGAEWAMNLKDDFTPAEKVEIKPALGRKLFERMVKSGKMKDGFVNPASPQQREEGDEGKELERLKQAVSGLKNYNGEHPPHLVFGELSDDEWRVWCAIHCAHHLGFAEPVQ